MLKKLLILSGIVLFLSCGGGSSKEAKELLEKILTVIGIPPSVITNICQTSNQTDMCEGITLNKTSNKKNKPWQKISQTEIGQYLIETNNPCEPILLELTDDDVVYDSGEFFLKFSGVELGQTTKELSILEAMVDASYLSANSVSSIKTLNSSDAQNRFYATLYGDLKKNINTLRTAGLTKTQSIRGTLKEMAEELTDYGIDSTLPTKINACNDDMGCVDGELTELSSKLLIYASETDAIVEVQKDNNAPLSVKEVSCEEEALDLNKGLVAYYKFEGNAKDSSGNGNDGTEYGGVSYSDGVIGQAGSFDGVDDYISSESDIINFGKGSNFTLTLWIKSSYNCNDTNYCGGIISKMAYNNIITGYQIGYNNESVLRFEYATNNNGKHFQGQSLIIDNSWHLLTVVSNNNVFKIYTDSKLETTVKENWLNGSTETNNPLYIGMLRGANYFYNGEVDDFRIYNRALNETEIAELYKMGNP